MLAVGLNKIPFRMLRCSFCQHANQHMHNNNNVVLSIHYCWRDVSCVTNLADDNQYLLNFVKGSAYCVVSCQMICQMLWSFLRVMNCRFQCNSIDAL
jgi:hypothetical protein